MPECLIEWGEMPHDECQKQIVRALKGNHIVALSFLTDSEITMTQTLRILSAVPASAWNRFFIVFAPSRVMQLFRVAVKMTYWDRTDDRNINGEFQQLATTVAG